MHIGTGGAINLAIGTDGSVPKWHQDREASASVIERCLGERLLYHSDGFLACYKSKIVLSCHWDEQLFLLSRMKCWTETGNRWKQKSRRKFYLFNINLQEGQKDSVVPTSSLKVRWRKYPLAAIPSHPIMQNS